MIDPGKLDQRVTIEAPTNDRLRTGEEISSWATLCEVWAAVESTVGNKRWEAQQQVPEATVAVTIRWRPGITAEMRVIHKGRVLWVRAALNRKERNEFLDLLCSERADGVRNHG